MDQVLSPGLTELKWKSEDKIPEFIENTMRVVSDVSGVVEIMKGSSALGWINICQHSIAFLPVLSRCT